MNCGLCGRPVYDNQPICEGCRKSRNTKGKRVQKKFDREEKIKKAWGFSQKEEDEEEEDAQAAWVD
ncbi:MAG: hypothetical protein V1921_07445 [Candidatus Altiarchaeota archaeon]